jgi:hypothetical protein
MTEEILQKYIRNSDLIQFETGTFDDFTQLKEQIMKGENVEQNLVLIFALGYFAANQFYTNEVRHLLSDKKLELKLSEFHEIVKKISGKPLS